jgi:hypothetical protein
MQGATKHFDESELVLRLWNGLWRICAGCRKNVSELAGREVVLSISFSLMRSNIDELPEAIALSRDVGFYMVRCRHVEAYTADMVQESLWHDKTRFNDVRERAIALAERLGVRLDIPELFRHRQARLAQRGIQGCGDRIVPE